MDLDPNFLRCTTCGYPMPSCCCNPQLGSIKFHPHEDVPASFSGGITFPAPARDPDLRRKAIDILEWFARWQGTSADWDFEELTKAMDALREELAK